MQEMPGLGVEWPDIRPADISPPPPGTQAAPTTQTGTGIVDTTVERRYRVEIEGVDGITAPNLRSRFDEASTLRKEQGSPANTAQINRRARDDETLLRDLLRSYGYYDADVTTRIDVGDAEQRLGVILAVEAGTQYRFASIDITGLPSGGPLAAAQRDAYTIKPGDPIDADKVVLATAALKGALTEHGYAFAKVDEPHVTIDHEKHVGALTLSVDPGGFKSIGNFRIEGKRLFGPGHLRVISRFRPGTMYDSRRIEDFRRALIATGLVSSVELRPVQTGDPNVVDISVRIEPAPPRTIAGELGYGTGEGAKAQVSWTHRNLIRPEGAVTFTAVAGTQEQSLGATLHRGNFRARDQVLTGQFVVDHTKRQAYDARTLTVGMGLEKQTNIIWQKKWTWSIGTEFLASDERDTIVSTGQPRRRTFLIGALPGMLAYDGTDNLLDPTRGFRLSSHVSPEISFQSGTHGYVRTQIDASAYQPFGRTVLAGRVRVGSIAGADRDLIAPSRRYYVGGGGSVRGFGYQDIGPRDANNDPIGGKSLVEFSIEARVRFGNFGVVPFLDAGNLYESTLPKFTGLRYGAGLGVRYYSSFGPIRVDVGTPIARRSGESKLGVYISLGQAF
jgi:translocation and assembly module TamA